MKFFIVLLSAGIAAGSALAQQPAAKTTDQQARSYIVSAFMTGAAPLVLSDDVAVAPAVRQRLGVAPDADSRAVYKALVGATAGKSMSVRAASEDEIAKTEARAQPGKPLFTIETGDTTLLVQYDLERDHITFIAEPAAQVAAASAVAVPSPVIAPAPPEQVVEAPKPAPQAAPAAEAAPAAPSAPLQVVEPREPRVAKPAAAPAQVPVMQAQRAEPSEPRLKPSGPCVIKPVMSDQDLVNCGATPR